MRLTIRCCNEVARQIGKPQRLALEVNSSVQVAERRERSCYSVVMPPKRDRRLLPHIKRAPPLRDLVEAGLQISEKRVVFSDRAGGTRNQRRIVELSCHQSSFGFEC